MNSPKRVKKVMVEELDAAGQKYGEPRRTSIVYTHEITETYEEEDQVEDSRPRVPLQGGVFQEDHPCLFADERRTRSSRTGTALSQTFETTQRRGDHVLYGPVPGVQDPPERV